MTMAVNEIMVSVAMITFNHEKYIEEAINGVLMQECDFDFELVIANDHSSDNTDAIIQKILLEHPKGMKIKYINRNPNIGMMRNFYDLIDKVCGKYVAVCEGDDYWTDPLKLQKQVDFLEKNENINLCFHQVEYVDINSQHLKYSENQFANNNSKIFTYENILEHWYINTCSIVFRKDTRLLSYLKGFEVGDQPLCYFINLDKDFYYFADIMASYRITNSGFMGTVFQKKIKSVIEFPFLDKINELSEKKYNKIIKKRKLNTIMKDLKFMKNSKLYTFRNRIQFYIRNFHFFLGGKKGIKLAGYSLLNYVI